MLSTRDALQQMIIDWARETFGQVALAPEERARRFLEEAVELVQAQGVPKEHITAIVEHVYNKPPGDVFQEVGGCSVTLLAYCAAVGLSAEAEEIREFKRCLSIDKDFFRKKHKLKVDAGIAVGDENK